MLKQNTLESNDVGGPSPLEELRRLLGYPSQEAFARELGVPVSSYNRWVSGKSRPALKPSQVKHFNEVFSPANVKVEDLPDDWGPQKTQSA
jgi:DNA-binding XRE family transcriptional regulator